MNAVRKVCLILALGLVAATAQAQDATQSAATPAVAAPAAAATDAVATPAATPDADAVATPAVAPATAAAPVAPAAAAAAAMTPSGMVGAPEEGKGQIVFFRPSKFVGGAVGFIVREGQTELGKLRNGNYFVLAVEPGTHQYTVHSEAKDVLTLEVEAGETYYVQGTISMGVFAGHPNLSPSDQAAFDAISRKLKPSKPLD